MAVFLFDKTETLIKMISSEECYESVQTQEHNHLIHHSIEIPFSDDLKDAVYFGMHDVDQPNDFLMYKILRVETHNKRTAMTGIHVFFDDIKADGVIRDIRPSNQLASVVLNQILDGSRWSLSSTSATAVASGSFYYLPRLEAFWKFIKTWNVEFKLAMSFSNGKITGRHVNIYDVYAPDMGKWYEIGDKLLTLIAEEDRSNVFTAFLGRGKGEEAGEGFGRRITFEEVEWSIANGDPVDKPLGLDFVEIPWATELYGYPEGSPRIVPVEYSDIDDPVKLLQKTYQDGMLNCIPKRQFSANVSTQEMAETGEIVTIIDDSIGVRYQTRIFKLTRDFLSKKKKSIEFGHKIARTQGERVRLQTEATEQLITQQESQLVAVLKRITESYWNEDGYNYELKSGNEFNLPAGYYSFDAPIDQNPTKVIYVGAGKMLIANSKDTAGEWIWRTAATADGLVGDALIANSVTANKLSADVGQALDLSSNIAVISRVTTGELNSAISSATSNLASHSMYKKPSMLSTGPTQT